MYMYNILLPFVTNWTGMLLFMKNGEMDANRLYSVSSQLVKGIVVLTSGLLPELQREFKNENTCVMCLQWYYVFAFSTKNAERNPSVSMHVMCLRI